MTKLEEIEALRQKLVQDIMKITNLSMNGFQVDISFFSGNNLISEAERMGWEQGDYEGAKWYTSEKQTFGETIVYVD